MALFSSQQIKLFRGKRKLMPKKTLLTENTNPFPSSGSNVNVICKSLEFDGSNEYAQILDTSAFNFDYNQAFTISTWIKLKTTGFTQAIFGKYDAFVNNAGYVFYINGNLDVRFFFNDVANNQLRYDFPFIQVADVWYNLIITNDGNGLSNSVSLYIDNSFVAPVFGSTGAITSITNTHTYKVGGITAPPFFLNAVIGNQRIWNSVLSLSDIADEYNNGVINQNIPNESNCILNLDFSQSTFNGSQFDIPNTTGQTSNFVSVNMEESDFIDDCPQ
jgi:hypothetical protein